MATRATTVPPRMVPRSAAQSLSETILRDWAPHLHAAAEVVWLDRDPYVVESTATRVLWLSCQIHLRLTEMKLRLAAAGVALLGLLRDLDVAVWIKTVTNLWPENITARQLLTIPDIAVGFAITFTTPNELSWVSDHVTGSHSMHASYWSDISAVRDAFPAQCFWPEKAGRGAFLHDLRCHRENSNVSHVVSTNVSGVPARERGRACRNVRRG